MRSISINISINRGISSTVNISITVLFLPVYCVMCNMCICVLLNNPPEGGLYVRSQYLIHVLGFGIQPLAYYG